MTEDYKKLEEMFKRAAALASELRAAENKLYSIELNISEMSSELNGIKEEIKKWLDEKVFNLPNPIL